MCNNVLEMWQKQGKEKLFIVRKLENTCVKRWAFGSSFWSSVELRKTERDWQLVAMPRKLFPSDWVLFNLLMWLVYNVIQAFFPVFSFIHFLQNVHFLCSFLSTMFKCPTSESNICVHFSQLNLLFFTIYICFLNFSSFLYYNHLLHSYLKSDNFPIFISPDFFPPASFVTPIVALSFVRLFQFRSEENTYLRRINRAVKISHKTPDNRIDNAPIIQYGRQQFLM